MDEPFRGADAKRFVRAILDTGTVTFTRHAREEMTDDDLDDRDVVNVLRGGRMRDEDVEFENGAWRYKARTRKIVIVLEFEVEDEVPPEELVVITAWRVQ